MDIEHDTKIVKIGPDFQKDIDQLTADGWRLLPGAQPVAVYQMFREKKVEVLVNELEVQPPGFAQGEMHVDDTLVGIVRQNGKFERF
jgi:hypothetical protein